MESGVVVVQGRSVPGVICLVLFGEGTVEASSVHCNVLFFFI